MISYAEKQLKQNAPSIFSIYGIQQTAKLNSQLEKLRLEYKETTTDMQKMIIQRKADTLKKEIRFYTIVYKNDN